MNILSKLFKLIKRKKNNTTEKSLFEQMQNGRCPDCDTDPMRIIEGPTGGLSTNIKCVSCNAQFNICPVIEFAERIHEGEQP